eukprot:3099828-Pleurochrysis_carterae.AAC.1
MIVGRVREPEQRVPRGPARHRIALERLESLAAHTCRTHHQVAHQPVQLATPLQAHQAVAAADVLALDVHAWVLEAHGKSGRETRAAMSIESSCAKMQVLKELSLSEDWSVNWTERMRAEDALL